MIGRSQYRRNLVFLQGGSEKSRPSSHANGVCLAPGQGCNDVSAYKIRAYVLGGQNPPSRALPGTHDLRGQPGPAKPHAESGGFARRLWRQTTREGEISHIGCNTMRIGAHKYVETCCEILAGRLTRTVAWPGVRASMSGRISPARRIATAIAFGARSRYARLTADGQSSRQDGQGT